MNKLAWVKIFVVPMMEIAISVLENVDANSTGADDNAAMALRAAVAAIKAM